MHSGNARMADKVFKKCLKQDLNVSYIDLELAKDSLKLELMMILPPFPENLDFSW